jgi:site-specific DNA-methyltransferase (adenine-specific)
MSHFNPDSGRWPANLIHDGSPEVVGLFPEVSASKPGIRRNQNTGWKCSSKPTDIHVSYDEPSGTAARFFYTAKASPAERGPGNNHPTVKPIALMRYLCRLVTPPGGVVLDPFAGSGTTGIAACLEGFRAVLCEREETYLPIIVTRLGCEYVENENGGAELRARPAEQLKLF